MIAGAAELVASARAFLLTVGWAVRSVHTLASGGEALHLTMVRAPKGERHQEEGRRRDD